ncbi:MAG: Cof-type HAD-IIB family hydrolase [Bacteroidales bacterium]|nr:Cof-type HAD-IIB family hydrolase [Bacteroidales bacterium]
MIKAAFFDIDGTLLSFTTHRVSEGTVRAFDMLHRHGVHTFISSGRPQVLFPSMPLSFEGYITMNGALVFLDRQHPALLSNPIPADDLNAWLDFAKQKNLCTMVFTADGMMLAQPNEVGLKLRDQLEFTMPPVVEIDEMKRHEAFQIIALMPSELDTTVASFMPHCRLPRWHPAFTDIVANGNSKAAGMEAICRQFGIQQEETLAFGDGANDIEMLQWAGIGVAMGNAEQTVKEHADMVTTDVDHEGIENAVNKLFQ